MLYRRELCNLSDPREGEICLRIAGESLRNSEWTLVGGSPSSHYFDLDNYTCKKEDAKELTNLLIGKITELAKDYDFNKVALIDKGGPGPVGLMPFFQVLAFAINKEFVIVRPRKQLQRSAIKGTIDKGDRILLLSDVATVGWTIFEAAEKIWACNAKVPYALVVIDRYQGAITNLGRKGIELFSLFSAKSMIDAGKQEELEKRFGKKIDPNFETQLVDFGGSIVTTLR